MDIWVLIGIAGMLCPIAAVLVAACVMSRRGDQADQARRERIAKAHWQPPKPGEYGGWLR